MTPERWQRIEALSEAAGKLDPGQLGGFLDRECGDDPSLHREVEELIAHRTGASSLLGGIVAGGAGQWLTEDSVGERIGPYRILRTIGIGGMGTVYLGRRADEHYENLVAVKLIKRGMDSEEIVRRFRQERQILASLEHPNIARLGDGGATEEGLPYFVMEYVEGQPIDRYCDDHELSIAARLELFCTVCSAVQRAHQGLVVHRSRHGAPRSRGQIVLPGARPRRRERPAPGGLASLAGRRGRHADSPLPPSSVSSRWKVSRPEKKRVPSPSPSEERHAAVATRG